MLDIFLGYLCKKVLRWFVCQRETAQKRLHARFPKSVNMICLCMFNQSQYARIYCSAWLNNGIQSSSLCRRLKLILWALSRNAKRESTQLSQSTVHLCVGGKAICSSLHMNANQSRTTNGNATCEIHRPLWMPPQFCSFSVRLSCDTNLDGQRQPMQCQCVTVFRKGKGEKKLAGSRTWKLQRGDQCSQFVPELPCQKQKHVTHFI